jgi:hypothetical protein
MINRLRQSVCNLGLHFEANSCMMLAEAFRFLDDIARVM